MIPDFDLFEDLLSSISKIGRLTLEVWDGSGVVFSTNSSGERAPFLAESIRAVSTRVMDGGAPEEEPIDAKCRIVGVPIVNADETMGSLLAYPSAFNNGSPQDVPSRNVPSTDDAAALLLQLADLIRDRLASQKESEELAQELTRSFEDLHMYSVVATQVKALRFSSSMLSELIEELLDTMRSDLSFAFLPDRQEYNSLFGSDACSHKIEDPEAFALKLLDAIPSDEPTLEESYFILNDSREAPSFLGLHPDPFRFLAVRIQHNDSFYGWLGIVSFNLDGIFRRGQLRLLISVAEQVGAVLSNTDLYRDLESFVISVVKSLVYTIEAKDQYTHGHSRRVSEISERIADKLGLDDETKEDLKWAAILHDIGKIGIPEPILNKPEKLDDVEYDVIKGHPMKGHHILQPIEQLKGSLPGILHHHERFDGTGYPDGLKGEEIPLAARIIAIVDTFDAIASSRAYRSARPQEEALAVVEESAGTQLDPELVDLFKEAYDEYSHSNPPIR